MRIITHERPPGYFVIVLRGCDGKADSYYDGSVYSLNPRRAARFTDPAAAARFAEHLRYERPKHAHRIDVALPAVFQLRGPAARQAA
jgi:hypothetical protein